MSFQYKTTSAQWGDTAPDPVIPQGTGWELILTAAMPPDTLVWTWKRYATFEASDQKIAAVKEKEAKEQGKG